MSRFRTTALILAALTAATAAAIWVCRPLPARPPLEISLWYWHTPFRLTLSDLGTLKQMGVKRLFVRSATVRGGLQPRLTLPEQWSTPAPGLDVTVVLNVGYDVVRTFEAANLDSLSAFLAGAFNSEAERATRTGIRVSGVQLDMDCPTRLLPRYGDLLRRTRSALRRPGFGFSITALPTWLGSRDMKTVADSVDFIVPQFYEARVPQRVYDPVTISSLPRFRAGIRAAGRLGAPFYAGVPAYGHCLAYNGKGQLLGTYSDMGLVEAMQHPGLKVVRSTPVDDRGREATAATYAGEDMFWLVPRDMRVADPDVDAHDLPDHGLGRRPFYLRYDLPTPLMVARHVALLRQEQPPNCRGYILYRFPQPHENATMPLRSLTAAIHDESAAPHLSVRIRQANVPWEIIDAGAGPGAMQTEIEPIVTNDGTAGTHIGDGAVTVTLRLGTVGIEEARPGGFDSMESFLASGGGPPMRCSLPRANTLIFRKISLGAGESAPIGPIRLKPGCAESVHGEWTALGPGGFSTARGLITQQESLRNLSGGQEDRKAGRRQDPGS